MIFPTSPYIRHQLNRLSQYASSYELLDDATDASLWPSSGAGLTVSNENMPVYGLPAVKLSHTTGSFRYATRNYPSGVSPKHWLVFDVYIDDVSEVGGLRLEATSADDTLLFWQPLDANQTGLNADITHPRTGINRMFFRTSTFNAAVGAEWADVRNLRWRLRTNGGAVNVWVGKIETVDLRPKVTFIFDDQHETVYTFAYPEMSSRGFLGSVAVATGTPELQNVTTPSHPSGGYVANGMDVAQLAALQSAGWDLLSHTVTHCNLDLMYSEGLTNELAYESEESRSYLESTFGLDAIARGVMVGPYATGDSAGAKDILALTYGVQFTGSGYNTILRHEQLEDQKYANTWLRTARQAGDNKTTAELIAHIDAAIANQYWLVFMFHTFHPTNGGALTCVESEFTGALDYLVSQSAQVDVVSMKEFVVELLGSDPTAASQKMGSTHVGVGIGVGF